MTENPTNRLELIEQMRGRWERRVAPTMEAVHSYIEGFADARKFLPDDTWKIVSEWVYAYLGIEAEVQWHWAEQIARHSLGYGSEIPIFYGALDHGRQVAYRQKHVWSPTEEWRAYFDKQQKDFNTLRPEMRLPAPHTVLIACTDAGVWRIFFLDVRGIRYSERTGKSCIELKKWASVGRFGGIPLDSWKEE